MTFEVISFRVNRRQTPLISGLLQQVRYRTVANKFSYKNKQLINVFEALKIQLNL